MRSVFSNIIQVALSLVSKGANLFLWLAFYFTFISAAFLFSDLQFPFEDPPLLRSVVAVHLLFSSLGLLILGLQSRDWPEGKTYGMTVYLTLVLAASLPVSNLWLVFDWWDLNETQRSWVNLLLIPGLGACVGFFTSLAAADRATAKAQTPIQESETETAEEWDDLALAEYLSQPTQSFDIKAMINVGLLIGLGYATLSILMGVGSIYTEAVFEALAYDRFAGWGAILTNIADALWRLRIVALAIIFGYLLFVLGSGFIQHVNQSAAIKPEHAERAFTETERSFVRTAIASADNLLASLPDRNRIRYLLVGSLCCITWFAFMMVGAIPFFLTLDTGDGIGANLFEASRTAGLERYVYFDGLGGFELSMFAGGGALGYLATIWLSGPTTSMAAKNWWFMGEGSRDQKRFALIAEIGRGVRRKSSNSADDKNPELPMARLNRRHTRGSVAAVLACLVTAVAIWPLDRAHYALVTPTFAEVGPYFPSGQISRRSLNEVSYVVDACFNDDDGDIRRIWRIVFNDDQKINLASNFGSYSDEEKALIIDVANILRNQEVSFRGRFNADECTASFSNLSKSNARFFADLYDHRLRGQGAQ